MSLYQREKNWYYDYMYREKRHRGCIGPVSKTITKEIMAKTKTEAVEGRYELPSKKPSPRLDEFVKEYFAYYQANRKPRSLQRHQTSYRALEATLGHQRLTDISPLDIERYKRHRQGTGVTGVTINRELAFLTNLYNKVLE